MIDALQRIRFGDYTAIEYFSKNARKKPFSSEEGVVYLCVKNRTAERINDVRVSKLSGQCDLRRDDFQNNALDTCVNSINSEEVPVSEEQPEDTTKEPSASDGRTISIKCPAHAAKAIFSFAQALTPDTKLVDSVLILPEEYKQAVKTFIEVIL